jgi:hypothetical protein
LPDEPAARLEHLDIAMDEVTADDLDELLNDPDEPDELPDDAAELDDSADPDGEHA